MAFCVATCYLQLLPEAGSRKEEEGKKIGGHILTFGQLKGGIQEQDQEREREREREKKKEKKKEEAGKWLRGGLKMKQIACWPLGFYC